MTPAELKLYLDVLRGADLMSVHIKLPNGEISCTFAPEREAFQTTPALTGVNLGPGGWKGPSNLDADYESELPE